MITSSELLKAKRGEILAVAAKYGAHDVRIFGSVAKGKAGVNSDIDLLVKLEQGRTLLDHVRLVKELEVLLGCKIDLATENSLKPRFREQVLNEAIPL
jgi:uncharacterized protein